MHDFSFFFSPFLTKCYNKALNLTAKAKPLHAFPAPRRGSARSSSGMCAISGQDGVHPGQVWRTSFQGLSKVLKIKRFARTPDKPFVYLYRVWSADDYMPSAVCRPLSTPENPMNAIANRPAVTRAIDMPRMPLGMLTSASCSRSPANIISARANPSAVANA